MKLLALLETINLHEGIMDAMIETAVPAAIERLQDEMSGGGRFPKEEGISDLFFMHLLGDPYPDYDDIPEDAEERFAEWLPVW